jgi:hypothetical protein
MLMQVDDDMHAAFLFINTSFGLLKGRREG